MPIAFQPSKTTRSPPHSKHPLCSTLRATAKMVKQNDTIAIIIIVLFVLLALIGFGIYRLVSIARNNMSSSTGSSSTGSQSIVSGD